MHEHAARTLVRDEWLDIGKGMILCTSQKKLEYGVVWNVPRGISTGVGRKSFVMVWVRIRYERVRYGDGGRAEILPAA